ncbi:MAG TPA: hypothetical protein VGJ54_09105 [Streptosporangiaceae bacterium]
MRTQPAKTGPALAAAVGRGVMRAIVQDVYGSADRLGLSEIEKPVIAADEVLVRVRVAGVDRGTCHLMRGEPYLMRILAFGFRGPKNRVPGLDVAGMVVAAGAGQYKGAAAMNTNPLPRARQWSRCATWWQLAAATCGGRAAPRTCCCCR